MEMPTMTDIVERLRVISANDMHILMTKCLDAAREIHIAMCLFDDDHVLAAAAESPDLRCGQI